MRERSIDKFWSQIAIGLPDECWPWKASINCTGYGKSKIITGKPMTASRVALAFVSERLPPRNIFALHSCDNPLCCNPHHLRWGTSKDNAADRATRGRHGLRSDRLSGGKPRRDKLDWAKVGHIRARAANGERIRDLASEYGVNPQTIGLAVNFRTWR